MASPPAAKLAKLEPDIVYSSGDADDDGHGNGHNLNSFAGFQLDGVLNDNPDVKTMFLRGRFSGDGRPAVVILEKTAFDEERARNLLTDATGLSCQLRNDIYGTYCGYPPPHLNDIKVTVIHPATEKHVEKYSRRHRHLVRETAQLYDTITRPYLEAQQFSLQWVYNILSHESEADRIVAEDADPETGFVLLPDMKWDGKQVENLYLVAIACRRDLRSVRDLNRTHLPLLKNIRDKGQAAVEKKYGLAPDRLRIYFHYQPSYYHLHVHFTALDFAAPGTGAEKAHLLDVVIGNLELMPDYYRRATLMYTLGENDPLLKRLTAGNSEKSQ